ncbi:MAG: hypothetical protein ACOX6L_08950, partial [Syntrophomonadaceae bacterium]
MKTRWLHLGLGVCIAYIVLCIHLPKDIFLSAIFNNDYLFTISYIVMNLIFVTMINVSNRKLSFYLLGLVTNTLILLTDDAGGYYYLNRAITIITLIIYTALVLIVLGISYLIK